MVAWNSGPVAVLVTTDPRLQRLHNPHTADSLGLAIWEHREVRSSSLVAWQLMMAADGAPAQEFLNQALKEHALDDS